MPWGQTFPLKVWECAHVGTDEFANVFANETACISTNEFANKVANVLATAMTGKLGVRVLRYRASAFTVGQRLKGLLEATNGNVLPVKEILNV